MTRPSVDAATRAHLQRTYMSLEPKYHELKKKIEPLTKPLQEVLLADYFDEEKIVKRFTALREVVQQGTVKHNSTADQTPAPTFSDLAYGSHQRNVLDFWQAKSDQPTPLAIYFHGGGFRTFDKSEITRNGRRR